MDKSYYILHLFRITGNYIKIAFDNLSHLSQNLSSFTESNNDSHLFDKHTWYIYIYTLYYYINLL